jgi:RimJ/RimL family protein N-acetyltransferase
LRRRDIEHGRASVGYWVAASHRRRGYAGRALRVLTDWAATLSDITRLELYVEPFNEPSWRAAESAGYRREGLLHRWQVVAGEPRDMYMYAKAP